MSSDVGNVVGSRCGVLGDTDVSQAGEGRTAVIGAWFASYVSQFDQTVEPSRQPAGGEAKFFGQVAHAHCPLGGFGKEDEDLVIAAGQAVFGHQIAVDVGEYGAHRFDEIAPREHFIVIKPLGLIEA